MHAPTLPRFRRLRPNPRPQPAIVIGLFITLSPIAAGAAVEAATEAERRSAQRSISATQTVAALAAATRGHATRGDEGSARQATKTKKSRKAESDTQDTQGEGETEKAETRQKSSRKPAKAKGRLTAALNRGDRSMHRRLGFGAQRTLSANNAAFFNYFVRPKLSLGWSLGVATFSHMEPNDEGEFRRVKTVGMLSTGPEVFAWPLLGPRDRLIHADVGIGVRALLFLAFTGADGDDDPSLNIPLEVVIETPVALRVFIGHQVAITPEFGLAIRWTPGSRAPDANGDRDQNPGSGQGERLGTSNGPGLGFELGNHTGMFIGLSVTYYLAAKMKPKSK